MFNLDHCSLTHHSANNKYIHKQDQQKLKGLWLTWVICISIEDDWLEWQTLLH